MEIVKLAISLRSATQLSTSLYFLDFRIYSEHNYFSVVCLPLSGRARNFHQRQRKRNRGRVENENESNKRSVRFTAIVAGQRRSFIAMY